MEKTHQYSLALEWTGNTGKGTNDYRGYERSHEIRVPGKAVLAASSDPAFRGDRSKHNPEELFLASIASCHMLWYLHLCASAGVVITAYTDQPHATMQESADGSGRFTGATLNPTVTITASSDRNLALSLHEKANQLCFIANSCNFPIKHQPLVAVEGE